MAKSQRKSNSNLNKRIVEYMKQFVTLQRLKNIEQTLEYRTRYLTVVLEDLYQIHNASAVLRSCEIFGIQDIHVIENQNKFDINPDIVLGASKWLNIIHYNELENNTANCLKNLKKQNYRIIATSPYENNYILDELPLDNKIALVFGTELRGLSKSVMDMADGFVKIPMYGFTQSFNISVSAAICLYNLTSRLHNSNVNWKLNEYEKTEIMLQWLKNSIKNPDMIIKKFLDSKTKPECKQELEIKKDR